MLVCKIFCCYSLEQGGLSQRTLIIGKSGSKLVIVGEAIQQNTNLAVATYTSLEQVSGWQDEKWAKILMDSQVSYHFKLDFLSFKDFFIFVNVRCKFIFLCL